MAASQPQSAALKIETQWLTAVSRRWLELGWRGLRPATAGRQLVFRVETAVGETKYVAWGQGSFTVPER
ncbi:MAG: hypothetical protein ACE5FD_11240, partial [Anaerolineae bacterium]